MTDLQGALIIAGWVLCGFLAYGRTLAHFHRGYLESAEYYRNQNIALAWSYAILGPCGLVVALVNGRHGFMWRLPPRDGP